MEQGSDIVFYLFGNHALPVTSYVTTMWAIMLVFILITFFTTRRLEKIPGRFQALVEYTIETLLHFFAGIYGGDAAKARRYFPLLATFFLFILFSNWSGILPGSGHFIGFKPPTSTWSVTLALAIIAFFSVQVAGVREKGIGYLKHFIEPIFMLAPLNIIEELVHPLSLSLRLYGNIYGEEMVAAVLLSLAPYFSPIPMQLLGLLFGFIQALVFTTLASIYIAMVIEQHH